MCLQTAAATESRNPGHVLVGEVLFVSMFESWMGTDQTGQKCEFANIESILDHGGILAIQVLKLQRSSRHGLALTGIIESASRRDLCKAVIRGEADIGPQNRSRK